MEREDIEGRKEKNIEETSRVDRGMSKGGWMVTYIKYISRGWMVDEGMMN